MRIGCGTDITEISRIKDSIQRFGEIFLKKIYTDNEIEYCEQKNENKFQHYAARFAAKEAIYKAINNFSEKMEADFLDAEIINSTTGKPKVRFLNKLVKFNECEIDLSISHCREYSVATVVIVFEKE